MIWSRIMWTSSTGPYPSEGTTSDTSAIWESLPPGEPRQPEHGHADLFCRFHGRDDIGRVPRGRYRHENVPALRQVFERLAENVVEVRVVRPSGHQRHVIGKRNHAQPRPGRVTLVAERALAQIVHHVRRRRGAAAIANDEDLPSLVPRVFDGTDDLIDGFERKTIQDVFQSVEVIFRKVAGCLHGSVSLQIQHDSAPASLQAEGHFAQVGQRVADRLPFVAGDTQQEKPAPARAGNLPANRPGLDRALVNLVQLGAADARREFSLRLPPLMKDGAQAVDIGQFHQTPHLMRLAGHLFQDFNLPADVGFLLRQNGGRLPCLPV